VDNRGNKKEGKRVGEYPARTIEGRFADYGGLVLVLDCGHEMLLPDKPEYRKRWKIGAIWPGCQLCEREGMRFDIELSDEEVFALGYAFSAGAKVARSIKEEALAVTLDSLHSRFGVLLQKQTRKGSNPKG